MSNPQTITVLSRAHSDHALTFPAPCTLGGVALQGPTADKAQT